MGETDQLPCNTCTIAACLPLAVQLGSPQLRIAYQFKGSFGSEDGVGIKMISLVAWSRRRTLPKVLLRPLSTPSASWSTSRDAAMVSLAMVQMFLEEELADLCCLNCCWG